MQSKAFRNNWCSTSIFPQFHRQPASCLRLFIYWFIPSHLTVSVLWIFVVVATDLIIYPVIRRFPYAVHRLIKGPLQEQRLSTPSLMRYGCSAYCMSRASLVCRPQRAGPCVQSPWWWRKCDGARRRQSSNTDSYNDSGLSAFTMTTSVQEVTEFSRPCEVHFSLQALNCIHTSLDPPQVRTCL